MTGETVGYDELHGSVAGLVIARDLITAVGPDTRDFLQGQLSQDLGPLSDGQSARSLLLQPQGKMVAALRVTCGEDGVWFLDVAAGYGELVRAALERFKLRTKCELDLRATSMARLVGPESATVEPPEADLRAAFSWSGLAGVDLVGDSVVLPEPVPECSAAVLQAVRIEAGHAAMGSEIDESTIPAEANLVEGAVSFTKGCYTGQELVARLDSRGSNTPRRLRGLVWQDEGDGVAGELVDLSGRKVGVATSTAFSPGHGKPIGLGYLGRTVEPGSVVMAAGSAVEVRDLPMFPQSG